MTYNKLSENIINVSSIVIHNLHIGLSTFGKQGLDSDLI